MDTKQQQFLMIVQTMFLAHAITLQGQADPACGCATAAYGYMSDAIDACTRIPADMDAAGAAHAFAFFMLENLRDEGCAPPAWFART